METHSEGRRWPKTTTRWWKGFPKRIWWPCTWSHQSHILDSGAKVRGVKATPPTATQVRRDSRLGLISDRQPAMLLHHMRCRYLTTNIKTFLSPDAQSFTAAIKLYSEAKKTQLFQQNIRTRLVSYVQMTGEHWCVCVCLQRQRIVHTHTHTHRHGRGADTQVGEGCFFTQPWQCHWGCLTQKVWTFLEFQLKICYIWEKEN